MQLAKHFTEPMFSLKFNYLLKKCCGSFVDSGSQLLQPDQRTELILELAVTSVYMCITRHSYTIIVVLVIFIIRITSISDVTPVSSVQQQQHCS